ncbi:MAG: outer membrane protein assembly factor BamE [Verrucomicrobiota bacterium]|nr:outer membrane protein assembly factor BamE [Verrucomicrobiota bacterium]
MKRLIASVVIGLLLGACVGPRLTQANVDEVSDGMTRKQVESILGPPTMVETKDFLLLKRSTYIYKQQNGTVTILFKDDRVIAKASTLPK